MFDSHSFLTGFAVILSVAGITWLVSVLKHDVTQTVIGRAKRDYVWIMARQPTMPESDYQRIVELLGREGYDTAQIRKVPQRWEPATGLRAE